jgi:hypothetical protein
MPENEFSHNETANTVGDGFDVATETLDLISLGEPFRIPLKKVEEAFGTIEKKMMIDSVQKKFHDAISQKVATKISSFATPSLSSSQRTALSAKITGEEYLKGLKERSDASHNEIGYKLKRKAFDNLRNVKKKPYKLATIPLTVVPDVGVIKTTLKVVIWAGETVGGARRDRRKGEYLDPNNSAKLISELGQDEYDRKQVKWKTKGISDLGISLQRNLPKLKDAVHDLNIKIEQMNVSNKAYVISKKEQDKKTMELNRENAGMSMYHVQHYINKIKEMSTEMEATATIITAYMVGLESLMDKTSENIKETFK